MAKNEYTRGWALAQIEKRKAEQSPLFPGSEDVPDLGLESDLQKKVLDYCEENGWPCFHDRSKKVNEPGWMDNFIFLGPPTHPPGLVLLIELKSESGTFRKEQKELRLILYHLGHKVYSARSFKRVVEIIERERRR